MASPCIYMSITLSPHPSCTRFDGQDYLHHRHPWYCSRSVNLSPHPSCTRFDGAVKLKAISVIGGSGGTAPAKLKVCVDRSSEDVLIAGDGQVGS